MGVQKNCKYCIAFLKSTYHEIQTKHIPIVFEYQSQAATV